MKAPPPPPGCDPDSIVLLFDVPREHAGLRLDRFIQLRIPRLSRTRATRVVKGCAYREDGTRRRPSERVKAGETVWIVRPPMDEPAVPLRFDVAYEDEAVLVIDKPAGLPMHPTATYYRHTLSQLLVDRYPERTPQFAHRLDRETSGLVICGWTTAHEIALKRCFESRKDVQKRYVAIVEGVVDEDEGEIELPMANVQEGLHVMMETRDDGLPASTRFRVLERCANATLVALWPKTGRQHQLRVHMAALGHPMIGDKLYGAHGCDPFIRFVDGERSDELLGLLGHPRHALHAECLAIAHPIHGRIEEYVVPMADDMKELWRRRCAGEAERVSFQMLTE